MVNLEDVITRIKKLTSLQNNKEVAELFDLSAQDFSNRKKKGTLLPLIVDWAINEGVNVDWLLTGKEVSPVASEQAESSLNYYDIHEKIRIITGLHTKEQLAKFLGVEVEQVNEAERRFIFPIPWLYKIAMEFNLSLDWLILDKSPIHQLDRVNEPVYYYGNQTIDSELTEIVRILVNDLPEVKSKVLKVLRAKKSMKEALREWGSDGEEWF